MSENKKEDFNENSENNSSQENVNQDLHVQKEENNNTYEYNTNNDLTESNFKNFKDIFNQDTSSSQKSYEWDFQKYRQTNKSSKEKTNKNKGAIVFASILGVLIIIPIISICGVKLSNWFSNLSDKQDIQNDSPRLELNISSDNNINSSVDQASTSSSSILSATQIAKKVIPSIVSVIPYARVQNFYQTGVTEIGGGSGIIMNSDGYIITNAHVILKLPSTELVDAVKVILSDDKEYEAKIIGVDINTDLAIIKIDANNLPYAEFGNSDLLEVGEQVFAIGNPGLEFAGSMTSGIVSALNRTTGANLSIGCDIKYIQTDASINPGNSGGALVNTRGQVVGINSRKLSDIDVEGMGFAIPISQAKTILDNLINFGYVKGRVKVGIVISKEIDEIISKLNDVKTGLLIESVEANQDLVNNGILKYDILHEFDGVKITSVQELKAQLKNHHPGDTVHLVFYRYDSFGNNEQKIEIDIKLIEDESPIKR